MLELKEYQNRALYWLKRYFENCRRLGKAGTAFYETTSEIHEGDGIGYRNVKELPGLPYVCLRIPTGGGKTLVACHAVAVANKHLLQTENSLVVWLVPSDAIREQTLKALRNREHPYRQALDAELGTVAILDVAEALYLTKSALDTQTVIVIATMQAFRRENKEGLLVYRSSGNLMSHFQGVPEEILKEVERNADGTFDYSLCNVFRVRKPVVIVDEAHNARTPLSFDTLARFGPSCILELTATPNLTGGEDNPASNVLYSVSAAELKAEHMIKLPIKLKARAEWKELLGEAIGIRNGLEKAAERERKQPAKEYIRPIMLLQAQPKSHTRQTLTVEVVEKCLLEDFKIPKAQIARATGEDRGLEGVDLSKTDCPIRYIITVQALKEGWDCPFAYVLCSVMELHAATAVEQILGRVLRLPKATKKTETDLNFAYAFTASANFAASAKSLTDGLIQNGFERQEAKDLIAPLAEADFDKFELGELAAKAIAEKVTAKPAREIPSELSAKVEFDPASGTVKINAALNADEEAQLKECFEKNEAKEQIAAAVQRVRIKVDARKSPAERGEIFRVPVLAVKQGDFYEQFEKTHLDGIGWTLKGCDAGLAENEFSLASEIPQTGEVDISEAGKLEARFMPELEKQMTLLSVDSAWPLARLANWLDRSFLHRDLTPTETGVFITNLLMHLAEARMSLEQLTANRYKLSRAIERKIAAHRAAAQTKIFNEFLSPKFATPLVVSKEAQFQFPPDAYPASSLYKGGYRFKKHYFQMIGDLKPDGEEFDCAVFLDNLPEVKFWVRNLPGPGRETTSFWLQTSTDKFYPDFVCLLAEGRILVVEYKNATDWSNDDNKEKRALGELWEERSGGSCVFYMPKGSKDVETVKSKIK